MGRGREFIAGSLNLITRSDRISFVESYGSAYLRDRSPSAMLPKDSMEPRTLGPSMMGERLLVGF